MLEKVRYSVTKGTIKAPSWEPLLEPCQWAAILRPGFLGDIEKDEFLDHGPEGSFHIDRLYQGAAVVFSADFVTVGPRGGRTKNFNRWYGVVRELGLEFIEIERFASEEKAVLATDIARERAKARADGTAEPLKILEARRDELLLELSQLEYLLGVEALFRSRPFSSQNA